MKVFATRIILLLLLSPWMMSCSRTKKYSEETWLEAIGGTGSINQDLFIPGDCGPRPVGRYDVRYFDGVISIQHNFRNGTTVRAGGGVLSTINTSDVHWTGTTRGMMTSKQQAPYAYFGAGYNWDYFGLEGGAIVVIDSFHNIGETVLPILRFRFGDMDGLYGMLSISPHGNFLGSGDVADAGVGYKFKEWRTRAYVGAGGGFYRNVQGIVRVETEATNSLILLSSFNAGIFGSNNYPEDALEYGASLGFRFKL